MSDIKSGLTAYMKALEETISQREQLPEEEKQRLLAEEKRQEEEQRKADLLASYQAKGITPRYYDSTWENWMADTEQKRKVFEKVKTSAWKENLFLSGESGSGKTHLAICLAKDGATYKRLPDIFREVRLDFEAEQRIIDRYGTCKLLVIDEVGRQKFSDFEKNLFFEIIDKRWNHKLPTLLITNLKSLEFVNEFGKAIMDRLQPTLVSFTWESERGKQEVSA